MLRILMGAVVAAAALLVIPTAQAQVQEETSRGPRIVAHGGDGGDVRWIGVAVSRQGRVFTLRDQGYESPARLQVLSGCEMQSGSSCQAISVPEAWDVVAVSCSRGGYRDSYLGGSMANGSGNSYDRAEQIARAKAAQSGYQYGHCREVYRY